MDSSDELNIWPHFHSVDLEESVDLQIEMPWQSLPGIFFKSQPCNTEITEWKSDQVNLDALSDSGGDDDNNETLVFNDLNKQELTHINTYQFPSIISPYFYTVDKPSTTTFS